MASECSSSDTTILYEDYCYSNNIPLSLEMGTAGSSVSVECNRRLLCF